MTADPLPLFGTRLFMADEPITDHGGSPDDLELLRRISGGDTERYAELIGRYQRHVTRIVGRRVPADRVEEVVHDVFVRAFLGLARFSRSVSIERWLAGVAVRTCYDFWRARRREDLPASALTGEHHEWIDRVLAAQSEEEFQRQARRREAADVLDWALAQLSPENRAVLTLVHLDGYSVREAAALLGWSVINVKVRAHRAKKSLRAILADSFRGRTS